MPFYECGNFVVVVCQCVVDCVCPPLYRRHLHACGMFNRVVIRFACSSTFFFSFSLIGYFCRSGWRAITNYSCGLVERLGLFQRGKWIMPGNPQGGSTECPPLPPSEFGHFLSFLWAAIPPWLMVLLLACFGLVSMLVTWIDSPSIPFPLCHCCVFLVLLGHSSSPRDPHGQGTKIAGT